MQPEKDQLVKLFDIGEPSDASQGCMPEMCAGCPERHEPHEGHLPLVYSLEDPVEYHFAQVPQVAMHREADAAQGLRALLQGDPDVIILGEVRRPAPKRETEGD